MMKPRVLLVPAPPELGQPITSGVGRYLVNLVAGIGDRVDYTFLDHHGAKLLRALEGSRPALSVDECILPAARPTASASSTSSKQQKLNPLTNSHGLSSLRLIAGYGREAIRFARLLRPYRERVDIIHLNKVGCEIAPIAAKMAGFKKVLTTIHNLPGEDQAATYWVRRMIEHISFFCGDLHIAVSDAAYEAWKKRVGLSMKKTIRIYNGLEQHDYSMFDRNTFRRQFCDDPDSTVIVGIVARLHHMKGHTVLLEAFARLLGHRGFDATGCGSWPAGRGQKVILLVAGDGPEQARIEMKIAELGIAGSVKLIGRCDNPFDLIAALDINVLPSTTLESIGYSVIEAMFAGVPSIVSDVGGAKEIIVASRGGIVVRKGNVDDLVGALTHYILNRDCAVSDGRNGRSFAELNLTARNMGDATMAIYERLAGDKLRQQRWSAG